MMPIFGQNRMEYQNRVVRAIREAYLIAQQGSVTSEAFRDQEEEGIRWAQSLTPNISNFPFISAEVGYTAPTAAEVAQVFRQKGVARRAAWAQLERVRVQFVGAYQAATTVAQTLTAFSTAKIALIAWTRDNAPLALDRVTVILDIRKTQ